MAHLEEVLLRSTEDDEEKEREKNMVDVLPDRLVGLMLAMAAGLTRLVIAPITEVIVGTFIMVVVTEYVFVVGRGVSPFVWVGYFIMSFIIGWILLVQGMMRSAG